MTRTLLVSPIRSDFAPNRGILNKLGYQASALRSLGCDVTTVNSSLDGLVVDGERRTRYRAPRGPVRILNHYAVFYAHVLRECRLEDVDLLYVRYPGAIPALLWLLREAKRRRPSIRVVLEIATYPFEGELTDWKGRLLSLAERACSPALHRYTDLVVTFCGQREIYGIPAHSTGNGIDVDVIPQRPSIPEAGAPLRLLGVANVATWHAYDRLLAGMRAMLDAGGDPPHFDVAGDGPALAELRALAARLRLESHVTFHGMTTGDALDALFASSHIAVGSLGMHRIGLRLASSLKNREYCARGIPFLLGAPDADFLPEDCPWMFPVEASEAPVDVRGIVGRFRALEGDSPDYPDVMRRYAESRLTWRSKLAPVLARLGLSASAADAPREAGSTSARGGAQ